MLIEELVTQIGFPIAVVVYLLYERNTTTRGLIKALSKLEVAIIKLEGRLHGKI